MPRDGTDRPQKHRFTQSRGNQCITNRREDGRSHHLDWRCTQGTDSSSGCQGIDRQHTYRFTGWNGSFSRSSLSPVLWLQRRQRGCHRLRRIFWNKRRSDPDTVYCLANRSSHISIFIIGCPDCSSSGAFDSYMVTARTLAVSDDCIHHRIAFLAPPGKHNPPAGRNRKQDQTQVLLTRRSTFLPLSLPSIPVQEQPPVVVQSTTRLSLRSRSMRCSGSLVLTRLFLKIRRRLSAWRRNAELAQRTFDGRPGEANPFVVQQIGKGKSDSEYENSYEETVNGRAIRVLILEIADINRTEDACWRIVLVNFWPRL